MHNQFILTGMELKYTYTQEEKFLVGRLDDYPEYPTQGENREDLENGLKEIYGWIKDGTLEVKENSHTQTYGN